VLLFFERRPSTACIPLPIVVSIEQSLKVIMVHPRQITSQRILESLQSIDHANIAVAITFSLLDLTAHISELSLTHKASLTEEPESLGI